MDDDKHERTPRRASNDDEDHNRRSNSSSSPRTPKFRACNSGDIGREDDPGGCWNLKLEVEIPTGHFIVDDSPKIEAIEDQGSVIDDPPPLDSKSDKDSQAERVRYEKVLKFWEKK